MALKDLWEVDYKMRRRFLPIGQGAFYCEQFSNHSDYISESDNRINVIYDCGSLSGISLLHKRIEDCFNFGEKIHALFLSHFDEDHVNGLKHLLKHYRVEHIFFPLLTKEDKALICLQHLVNSAFPDEQPFWLQFALEPFEALSRMNLKYIPTLHPVRSEDRNDEDAEFHDMPEDYRQQVHIIRSGDDVFQIICDSEEKTHPMHTFDWLYIPFHFREKVKRDILKENLKESLGTCDPEELLDRLKNNPLYRADIKEAYSKIPGGFNTNSMVLFSGIESEHFVHFLIHHKCPCKGCCLPIKPGALYMGDYDASGSQKWQQLQRAYEKYIPYIGCLQVPHHGSKHNFNFKLFDIEFCQVYVISAGLNNQFEHPDGDVVKQIMLSGKYLGIVTEKPWSEIAMDIILCD